MQLYRPHPTIEDAIPFSLDNWWPHTHSGLKACQKFRSSYKDSSSMLIPICINYILQVCISDTIQTFLAARCHNCSGVVFDPFHHFPMLQAKMWSTELGPIEILAPDCIHAHFVKASLMWEGMDWVVVISLCCESHSFQVAAIFSDNFISCHSLINCTVLLLSPKHLSSVAWRTSHQAHYLNANHCFSLFCYFVYHGNCYPLFLPY